MCLTRYPEVWAKLADRFAKDEIKHFLKGKTQLNYITARTVMNRLDDVLGPENWWDEYSPQENSVICRLTIRLPDGSTITKCDAGGYAGMPDQGDDDKSGYSDSFKRAAVKFGIGRYLYRDGVPQFVRDVLNGEHHPVEPAPVTTPAALPTNGRDLAAWLLSEGAAHGVDLMGMAMEYARTMGWPGLMDQFTREQVEQIVESQIGTTATEAR